MPAPDATPPRRIHVIANPIAGGGRARQDSLDLAERLRDAGAEVACTHTQAAGDARAAAAQLTPATCDTVVAVGGDGTVNEVLAGLADGIALAVLPRGTANVLAAEISLPHTPAQAADLVLAGTSLEVPVPEADGRRFLLFVGAGFDGLMVRELERTRTGLGGRLAWVRPVWRIVWRWPVQRIDAELDDGTRLTDCSELLVTRSRNYGGMLRLPAPIDIEADALFVLAFRQRSRLGMLFATIRALLGGLRPGVDCELRLARTVTLTGAGTPWQVDGDLGGELPVQVALTGRRLRLLAPPHRSGS